MTALVQTGTIMTEWS